MDANYRCDYSGDRFVHCFLLEINQRLEVCQITANFHFFCSITKQRGRVNLLNIFAFNLLSNISRASGEPFRSFYQTYAKCGCSRKKTEKNLQNSKIMLTFAPAIQLEQ